MKIYVASSWRNPYQEQIVGLLREAGYEVYDFKHPAPGDNGFHWSEIDEGWKRWSPDKFIQALKHPVADKGFAFDMTALTHCDVCLLVLPSGRSAHLEAGYAVGAGKSVLVYMPVPNEPELMYKMVYAKRGLVSSSLTEIMGWLKDYRSMPV